MDIFVSLRSIAYEQRFPFQSAMDTLMGNLEPIPLPAPPVPPPGVDPIPVGPPVREKYVFGGCNETSIKLFKVKHIKTKKHKKPENFTLRQKAFIDEL